MSVKLWAKILIFLFAGIFSFSAHAAFDEIKVRDFLNATGEKFIETLGLEDVDRKYEILDEMFENSFDTDAMGRFVLGQSYRLLNEEQRLKYDELFKRYIKSLYKSYPLDFDTSEVQFKIVQITPKEKYVSGVVAVNLPEKYQTENIKSVRVEFKLKPKNDNTYLISDVLIADVSLLITLRSRFAQMLKDADNEPEWFLQDFEDLTLSNERQINLE